MAKKPEKLTLADLNKSLKSGDIKMNPAVLAQIEAAMASPAASASTQDLNAKIEVLANTIHENTIALTNGKSKSTQALDLSENQIETEKVEKHQTELLEKIEENTRPDVSAKARQEPEPTDKLSFGKLGLIGTLLATTLGGIAGILAGKAKAMVIVAKAFYNSIKFIGTMIGKAASLVPDFIKKPLLSVVDKVIAPFRAVAGFFESVFSKIFGSISTSAEKIISIFKGTFESGKSGLGKIASVFSKIKSFIVGFFSPVTEFLSTVKQESSGVRTILSKVSGVFQSVGSFFGNISTWFGSFGKVLEASFKFFQKLAVPITIIMGLFDGITEAIKGYKEGGILGGIQGFISGVLNSVVGSFLDLIKSAVSWILGKLGFKEAEKFLDSFSFSQMIKDLVHAIFHPIDTIKSLFKSIAKWLSGLQIPAIDVPLIGKLGPWKPFEYLGVATEGEQTIKPTAVKPAAPANQSAGIYGKSAENEAKKIAVDKKVIQAPTVVTTQQVNNQSQNAFMKTPIRNNDSSINRYMSMAF